MADGIRYEEWPFRRSDWESGPLTEQWIATKSDAEQTKLREVAARIAVNVGSTPGRELERFADLLDPWSAVLNDPLKLFGLGEETENA